ncbi:1-acyl-sn-glycerol-3-phosphate acyltransferase [Pseudohalioglobus sediminis]|uniref:1-acyl-sn-glycerol-3-phosphate acyltransferase n=1 Tax=Pseudohalioglobus sediminis TaxID=2606449 RepID=A0A5B0WTS5_9GAMM|nr:lysophospholipid acyltransferase family protein [Pseudohalioglobus sediminis]KAA1190482.1 1-acyl-sn-glycerol-3-phosphate acyltransferase [Pseudohalioglobus sediminis]
MNERQDFYYWRVLATGICFTLFGVGGLLMGLVLFPILALFSRDPRVRTRRCRLVIHHAFRLFIKLIHSLGLLTYSLDGEESLRGEGVLVIANHPTLIDVIFLVAQIPNASCIVKAGLFQNPFTRGPVSWAGYIPNTEPEELFENCQRQLEEGANLVIFPEGTRSIEGRLHKFRRGAAYIWLRFNCDLALATLNSEPPTLAKNTPWYKIPRQRFHYSLKVRRAGETTLLQPVPDAGDDARSINRQWQEYFQQELTT